jgi:hypothetical protein
VSAANHRARNVRPADCSAASFLKHCIHLDFHAESLELVDDLARAGFSCIPKIPKPRFEQIATLNVKRKKMNLARAVVRAQLDPGNDSNSKRLCRALSFIETRERIMIGECDRRQLSAIRSIDDS